MRYYRISNSLEKQEIGHYPQIEKTIWDGMPYDKNSFGEQGLFSSKHIKPALPILEFYKSAKTTSLIDIEIISNTMYLVVTEKFLEFLKSCYIGTFQTWEISAKHKEAKYNYFILFLDIPKHDFINYEKSIFRLYIKGSDRKKLKLNEETVKVISDEDCMDKYRQYPQIGINKPFFEAEKIVVNAHDIDFFRSSSPIMTGYYVSEKLKNEIEKQGFTGIRFQELNEINNFIEVIIEN